MSKNLLLRTLLNLFFSCYLFVTYGVLMCLQERRGGLKRAEMINCRDTYIVRVYRYTPDNPRAIIGVVETIGNQGRESFTNLDELWEILNEKRGKAAKKQGERKQTS